MLKHNCSKVQRRERAAPKHNTSTHRAGKERTVRKAKRQEATKQAKFQKPLKVTDTLKEVVVSGS